MRVFSMMVLWLKLIEQCYQLGKHSATIHLWQKSMTFDQRSHMSPQTRIGFQPLSPWILIISTVKPAKQHNSSDWATHTIRLRFGKWSELPLLWTWLSHTWPFPCPSVWALCRLWWTSWLQRRASGCSRCRSKLSRAERCSHSRGRCTSGGTPPLRPSAPPSPRPSAWFSPPHSMPLSALRLKLVFVRLPPSSPEPPSLLVISDP